MMTIPEPPEPPSVRLNVDDISVKLIGNIIKFNVRSSNLWSSYVHFRFLGIYSTNKVYFTKKLNPQTILSLFDLFSSVS
jgi:hypothetical protein